MVLEATMPTSGVSAFVRPLYMFSCVRSSTAVLVGSIGEDSGKSCCCIYDLIDCLFCHRRKPGGGCKNAMFIDRASQITQRLSNIN